MRFFKFLAAFVLAFMFVVPTTASASTASNNLIHYVALGDSLAAGITSDGTLGFGYSDNIAAELQAVYPSVGYHNTFAFPGAKATDFIKAFEEDLEIVINTESGESLTLLEEVKNADIITLSIGANDILASVDRSGGKLEYDPIEIFSTISKTAANINTILNEIKKLNPSAKVYVMGLYNPFPQKTDYSFQLNYLVGEVDKAFKAVVDAKGMTFVPVSTVLASKSAVYLPNPDNIHPSEAGYEAIAKQFLGPIKKAIPYPTFKDVKPDASNADYISKAGYYGIMKGYDDGTFKPNKKLTRAHVTSMMVRVLDLKETKKVPYTDLSKLAPETQTEISKAYAAGLIENKKMFNPNEVVSRLEVAKMIDKAYSIVIGRPYRPDDIAPFTDISKLTKEEKQIVTLLYDFEIATGDNGKFKPTSTITRSQAAKMFVNLKEKLK